MIVHLYQPSSFIYSSLISRIVQRRGKITNQRKLLQVLKIFLSNINGSTINLVFNALYHNREDILAYTNTNFYQLFVKSTVIKSKQYFVSTLETIWGFCGYS